MKFNLFIYFLFLFVNSVLGQHLKFKSLTTKDGLSNNSVKDLINDKDGQLWIATWDGVNIYDGHKVNYFKHIQNDSLSIASNDISKFVKDKNNQIWMLSYEKSISTYQGNGIFKNYYFKDQPSDILLSKNGLLVVNFSNKFYNLLDGDLVSINEHQIKNEDTNNSLKKFLLKRHPGVHINDILKDIESNIWYATRENGLFIIPNTADNDDIIIHYNYDQYSPYSITSNEIVKIHEDNFGNVWLGHKDGGVSMAHKGSENLRTILRHPINYPHLPNETIRAITRDNDSKVWLGYYTEGLFYFDKDTNCFLPYIIKESNKNGNLKRIRSLYTDSKGIVWAGTYGGIIRIDKNGYNIFNSENFDNIPNNRHYSFFEDNNENLWIACWGGLAKFNLKNKKFVSFKNQEKLNSYNIRHITIENDLIAIATEENGFLLFDINNGNIKQITVNDGLLGNSIFNIYFDKKTNYYWIACLGGISIYDLEKGIIKNITEEEGLPSHMVYSLIPNHDKIWISTTKGIAYVNTSNYSVTPLPPDQGWQSTEFSEGAAFQDEKGILYYGGINGLNYFQPNSYDNSLQQPKLKITVNNDENFSASLEERHVDNEIKISITPISFTNVIPTVFYKMNGFDGDWKILNNNELTYKKLPSGQYDFFTRIGNNERTITKVFQLKIEKPFYKTASFYLIISTLVSIVVLLIITRKNVLSKKKQKQLEEKINRRTSTIESQKQDLLKANQNLEAFNRKVLSQKEELQKQHYQIKNQDFEAEKFKTFVLSQFKPKLSKTLACIQQLDNNSIKDNIQEEVMSLVEIISQWDYLNQVKDLGSLKPSQIKFKALITNLYNRINDRKINGKSTFSYNTYTKSDAIQIDVLRFRLLFQYLLNEILKYTRDQNELKVTCLLESNQVVINIEETGELLKEQWSNIEKFSPYFKAAQTLLNDLNGELRIVLETGIKISASIPIINQSTDKIKGNVILKHLYNNEKKSDDLPVVLVFCDTEEVDLVYQILHNQNYQLVFEHDIQAIASASQQLPLCLLVIYNFTFTHERNQLLQSKRFKKFPIIYITEQLDYSLHEQALEAGVTSVIHLPASVDFIHKKTITLIHQYQSQFQSKIEVLNKTLETTTILNGHEKLVKKAMGLIKDQLGDTDFNVDKLIGQLEISRTKCYRIFKEVMSQSPSEVIISLRLQKAEQLLILNNLNISEISFECGFNDPKYFSRLFKKRFGTNPKSFQKVT